MGRRLTALAAVFTASMVSGPLPVGAQGGTQDQPSLFRTDTRLVQVSVTVTDSRGEPVTDLDAGDFTIRESGRVREIALFRFEGATPVVATRPALPAGVFSNQVQVIGGPSRHMTALVLDALNTSPVDNWFVRAQVLQHLKESLTPETRVGIYLLGNGLKTITDFTDDPELLRSRLDETVIGLPPQSESDADRMIRDAERTMEAMSGTQLEAAMRASLESQIGFEMLANIPIRQDRIRRTLDAFDALGRHLEGIPGRKSIVWVSGGFSALVVTGNLGMGPSGVIENMEAEVREAARRLAQRGVALYIVDAKGLRGERADASSRGSRFDSGSDYFDQLRRATELSNDPRGTMAMMASVTGGRYLFDTNDMAVGLRRAASDLGAAYTLGFYTADADDKWHPLDVRVGRPGVTVRSRQGWIAASGRPAATAPSAADPWRRSMDEALGSSAILLMARCQPAPNEAAGTIELILRIDANGVAFEPEGGRFVSVLDVVTVDRTASGVSRPFAQRVTVSWDASQLAVGRAQGIAYVRTWKPQDDVTSIRVSVRDRTTGEFGTLDMPMSEVLAAGNN
jgi:VWFA-related protein